jgi:hypothetical protein
MTGIAFASRRGDDHANNLAPKARIRLTKEPGSDFSRPLLAFGNLDRQIDQSRLGTSTAHPGYATDAPNGQP